MSAARAVVGIYNADPWDWVGGTWTLSNRAYSDISCLCDSASIRWGREDYTDTSFTAGTATVNLAAGDIPGMFAPPNLVVGSWLMVWAIDPNTGTPWPRFTGRITDINWAWSPDGAETPLRAGVRIQAASRAAELARTTLPAQPGHAYHMTYDAALTEGVSATAALTGRTWPALVVTGAADQYPGQGNLIRYPDKASGWTLADWYSTLAEHTDSRVWERNATQQVIFSSSAAQMATLGDTGVASAAFAIDACDLLADIAWTLTAEVINQVTFTSPYTTPPGPVQTASAIGDGRFGVWADGDKEWWASDPTLGLNIAGQWTNNLLSRRRFPRWIASALQIDTANITPLKYSQLLHLEPMTTFAVTGLPAWSGTPGPTDYMRCEGWSETFTGLAGGVLSHEFSVNVQAGIGLLNTPPGGPTAGYTWDDVYPSITWDMVAPAITWNDVEQNTLNPDGSLNPALN